jgi:predicted CxxxxCH...CXXCH cytochrome family protein
MILHRPSRSFPKRQLTAAALVAASAALGCVEPRAEPGEGVIDVTWVDDVAPLFAERCTGCHSAAQAAGDYRLDAYCEPALPSTETCAGVLGPGADGIPNVLTGDQAGESRLLAVFAGDDNLAAEHRGHLAGDDGEGALRDRLRLLERWVIDSGAAYFLSSIHDAEILDPRKPGFHGRDIAAADWRMGSCRGCHGADYRGGAVEVSCLTCHRDTPEACDTCHGTGQLGAPPPGLDAGDPAGPHREHLVDAAAHFVPVECADCHHVPTAFDDPAHIGENPDNRAEVLFGEKARARGADPAWNAENRTCANVACHGAGLTGASMPEPTWALDTGLGCGSCHGTPPETMANGEPHSLSPRCEECHPVVTGSQAPFPPPEPAAHGDGAISLLERVTAPNCEGCHTGSRTTVPPFRDAAGNTDPADREVGAHAAHLVGSFLSAGMDCAACHAVPATVGDHDHVDADPRAEVVFGPVARAGGLSPSYDATTGTCSNTWCHGARLAGGQTVSPAWTTATDLTCTSCHGFPPDTPTHFIVPGDPVDTCGSCHGTVIDDGFNWTNQSLHVNGQVDLVEQR